MMWETADARLALLELLVNGTLKKRRSQATTWQALAELPWTRNTGRRDELGLVPTRRNELVALLDRVWPVWGAALAELTAHGLPPSPDGWTALEDARRAEGLPALPDLLNRRTAAALVAPHSKAELTERRLEALGEVETTHDGSVRIRPPRNLIARAPRGTVDLAAIAGVLGEAALPERALKGELQLEGPLRAVLLVENLGTFCDLPALDGWMFAHVAGWDTVSVNRLLERVMHVPVVHFGDLDPNGVRIYRHLRERLPALRWFVPLFWEEYVATKAQRTLWPEDLDLTDTPEFVRSLASRDLWLEQEVLAVDSRTPEALEQLLASVG